MSPAESRGLFYRWRSPIALAAVTVTALVFALLAAFRPPVVVYPTTDFARLPISASTFVTPAAPISCVTLRRVSGSPKLVDEACGSPASTFRVIGRVGDASRCVRDADLTYSWSSGPKAGAVCLDYDWAAGQCLHIAKGSVAKVDCAERG
ncbi:MAG: LppU/SCO3897 family protein, partial [Mycobacterium sp.]